MRPHQWNNVEQLVTLDIPNDAQNLIVTFHYYNPFQFTHQAASWVSGSNAWLGTEWTGTDAQIRAVQRDFTRAAAWSEVENVPLFMGEFVPISAATWNHVLGGQSSLAYWEFVPFWCL